jgi:hypothetical protein
VETDATDRIIVLDRTTDRIQVFDASGAFQFKFGVQGTDPGQLYSPSGVTTDSEGRFIVADNNWVEMFAAKPNSGDTDGDGTPDCTDGCPADPHKIAPGVCGCGVPDTDSEGDGIANCVDNCPSAYNPEQADSDHDGIGDACDCPSPIVSYRDADGDGYGGSAMSSIGCSIPAGYVANNTDCDDGNAQAWSPPVEVTHLRLDVHSSTHLTWDDQGALVGPGVTYDVLRGDEQLPVGSAGDLCEGSAILVTTTIDSSIPPVGTGYRYLVRGHDTCGAGTYGTWSNGTPRISGVCP